MDDMYASPEHNDSVSTNTHSKSPTDELNNDTNLFTQSQSQSKSQGVLQQPEQVRYTNNSNITDFLKNQNTTGFNLNVDSKAMVDTKMNTNIDTKAMVDVQTYNNQNRFLKIPNLPSNINQNNLNLSNLKNNKSNTPQIASNYKLTPQVATR